MSKHAVTTRGNKFIAAVTALLLGFAGVALSTPAAQAGTGGSCTYTDMTSFTASANGGAKATSVDIAPGDTLSDYLNDDATNCTFQLNSDDWFTYDVNGNVTMSVNGAMIGFAEGYSYDNVAGAVTGPGYNIVAGTTWSRSVYIGLGHAPTAEDTPSFKQTYVFYPDGLPGNYSTVTSASFDKATFGPDETATLTINNNPALDDPTWKGCYVERATLYGLLSAYNFDGQGNQTMYQYSGGPMNPTNNGSLISGSTIDANWMIGSNLGNGATYSVEFYNGGDCQTVLNDGTNPDITATITLNVPSAPDAVQNLAISAHTFDSIDITWDAAPGATSYNVYVDGVLYNNTTDLSIRILNLAAGSDHLISVTPVNNIGEGAAAEVTGSTDIPSVSMTLEYNGIVGQAFSASPQFVGTGFNWNQVATVDVLNLAPGITLNQQCNEGCFYVFEGTPELSGTFTSTVTITLEDGTTLSQDVTFTIASGPSYAWDKNYLDGTGQTITPLIEGDMTGYTACVYVDGVLLYCNTIVSTIQGSTWDDMKSFLENMAGADTSLSHVITVDIYDPNAIDSQTGAPLDGSAAFAGDSFKWYPTTLAVPGDVTGAASGSVTDTTATITWNAVDGAKAYNVYVNGVLAGTVSSTSFDLSGLTALTGYTIEIEAVNDAGAGNKTSVEFTTLDTPIVAPGAVEGLTSSNISDTGADLTWTAVNGATSYNVYVNGVLVGTTSNTSYSLSGLTAETGYTIEVEAVNEAGAGAKGSTSITTLAAPTTQTLPGDVTGVQASNVTDTTATISWTAATDANTYNIYVNGVLVGTTSLTTYDLTSLTADTDYMVEIEAVNEAGTGVKGYTNLKTDTAPVTPTPTVPGAVTGSTVDGITNTTAHLTWAPVTGATSYKVYVNGVLYGTYTFDGITPSVDLSGLTAGTDYTIDIEAINDQGAGEKGTVQFTTATDEQNNQSKDNVLAFINDWGTAGYIITYDGEDVYAKDANGNIIAMISRASLTDAELAAAIAPYLSNTGGNINNDNDDELAYTGSDIRTLGFGALLAGFAGLVLIAVRRQRTI